MFEIAIPQIHFDSACINSEYFFTPKIPFSGFTNSFVEENFPPGLVLDFAFALPSTKDVSLEIIEVRDTILTGMKLMPTSCGCYTDNLLRCNEVHAVDGWYFKDTLMLDKAFKWRSVKGAGFKFNLFSYKPEDYAIRIHYNVKAKISSKGSFGNIVLEAWLEDVYRTVFPNLAMQEYSTSDSVASYQVLYIYADHSNDFYGILANKLADLRYKQGWRAHTVSAGEIYSLYQPLFPAEDETTWIRRFVEDTFYFYQSLHGTSPLSYVGFVGPDNHDLDSLPGVRIGDGTRPPVTESTYSLPTYMPQLGVGRIWAVRTYGAGGTEAFVDRILQNETEYYHGENWLDFMFVSQTSDVIFGYVDAQAQEGSIRDAGFNLMHYTCHDTTMGMLPPGTIRGMNETIVSALEEDKFAAVWHFGHGTHNAWFKNGPACTGSGEGAITAYDLLFRTIEYPTAVISGGCRTAREIGYEFTGRGALLYYGGIIDGGAPRDFVSKLRGFTKIAGDAWRSHLIWSPRLIGDPLTRFYGPVEPTKFVIHTSPASSYNIDVDFAESLFVTISADGPARWLHDTKICITSGFVSNATPICKVVPYAGNQVVFSPEEVLSVPGLDLDGQDTMFVTCYRRDFITKSVALPTTNTMMSETTVLYTPNAGWNLISIPLEINERSLCEIFPEADQILTWNNALVEYVDASRDIPDPSTGYWLLFTKDNDTISVSGTPILNWERLVGFGWNILGSTFSPDNDIVWGTSHRFEGIGSETTPNFLIYYDAERGYYRPSMVVVEGEGYFYHIQGEGVLAFPDTSSTCVKSQASEISSFYRILGNLPFPPKNKTTRQMSVEVDWKRRYITIRDRIYGRPLSDVTVLVSSDNVVKFYDSGAIGESGRLTLSNIDINRPLRVLVKRPGYADYHILSSIHLVGGDCLWGNVNIWGDVSVGEGDTLKFLPGTEITLNREGKIIAEGNNSMLFFEGTANRHVKLVAVEESISNSTALIARNGGSICIEYTEFENLKGITFDGMFTKDNLLRLKSAIFHGGETISLSNRSHSAIFRIIDCEFKTGLEIMGWLRNSQLSKCLFQSDSCVKVGGKAENIIFENCSFSKYKDYACEIGEYSLTVFKYCNFSGYGTAISNSSEITNQAGVELVGCEFDALGGEVIIRSIENTQTKATHSSFKNYSYACAVSAGILDLGDKTEGFNCFYTGDADWTFVGNSAIVLANNCYFDTLKIPDTITVTAQSRKHECPQRMHLAHIYLDESGDNIPDAYRLGLPTPNPFNSNVSIGFDLALDAVVSIEVFNINGIKITDLIDSKLKAGTYRAIWNGADIEDNTLPSGIYLCKMIVHEEGGEVLFEEFRKMTLIK